MRQDENSTGGSRQGNKAGLSGKEGLRRRLEGHLHKSDIREISVAVQGCRPMERSLFDLLSDETPRVAENAAWVFTHFSAAGRQCLMPRRGELADMAMRTSSATLCRLLLTLLEALPPFEGVRADFFDFCLSRGLSAAAPPGIRTLGLKLAYAQSRPYPELVGELRRSLEFLEPEIQSPAVRCAVRRILQAVARG